LARRQIRQWHASQWLDGLVAGLGTAAVVASILVGPATSFEGTRTATVVNLAYPLADLLLLMMVVTVVAASGWRPGRRWWLLGAGMATFAIADSLYLVQVANGTFESGTWLDDVWVIGVAAMALAPWVRSQRHPAVVAAASNARLLIVPILFVTSSLVVLGWQAISQANHDSPVATSLAISTIVACLLRTSLTFREVRALGDAQRLARTDDLTGLPNRRELLERIDLALNDAPAASHTAVLLIDLDRFKEVNDSFGHHVGDELLHLVSVRLQLAMPTGALLARMGGDEFGVLLPRTDALAAVEIADAICQLLRAPFALEGLLLVVEASTGIALAPEHGRTSSMLLRHADVAMYDAKRMHVSHVVFDEAQHGGARSRLETVAQFRAGLDTGQLVLHYQPLLNLATGEAAGVEALLRWQHPERGLLYPDAFLTLAEQAGLMTRVADRVLEQALHDLQTWRDEFPQLSMSVNLSASNLQDSRLPGLVVRHLAAAGLPPDALTLEITEDVLIADADKAQSVLRELRIIGVWLSVDDYGTGYSSLGYLRELPVHELKLDRSFVGAVATDAQCAAIVRSTIDLSKSLGMQMVAEGVEDPAALALLEAWGCDLAQGFYIARPMPAARLLPWLRRTSDAARDRRAASVTRLGA
jgi:diguanylate cyclase (GGDEF)-like protein